MIKFKDDFDIMSFSCLLLFFLIGAIIFVLKEKYIFSDIYLLSCNVDRLYIDDSKLIIYG